MANKKPTLSRLRKIDTTALRDDVATWCKGCGEVLTHIHLCPSCMSILDVDPEVPEEE